MKGKISNGFVIGMLIKSLLTGCSPTYRPSVGTAVGIIKSVDGIQMSREDVATIGEGENIYYTHTKYLPAIEKLSNVIKNLQEVYVSARPGDLLQRIDQTSCPDVCKGDNIITMSEINDMFLRKTGERYKGN